MRRATSAKLLSSIIGIVIVLYVTAPIMFAFSWQLVHGRQVELKGITLRLDRGWIVLDDSVTRIPDNLFFGSPEPTSILVTPTPHCITDQSAAVMLNHLRSSLSPGPAATSTYATIRIGDRQASCVIVVPGNESAQIYTACISPERGSVITIHDTLKYQPEAVHMLQSAHETQPCKP